MSQIQLKESGKCCTACRYHYCVRNDIVTIQSDQFVIILQINQACANQIENKPLLTRIIIFVNLGVLPKSDQYPTTLPPPLLKNPFQ